MTLHLNATERPLSPTERILWAVDEACSLNFAMHFGLHGELDEARLRHALDEAQAMHPLLRVAMRDEGRVAWFRTDGVGLLPLRIVDGPPDCLAEEAEREVNTRFDCSRGPLARCVWLRHGATHSTLILTFQHVIGDGTSGALLIRDLLRALAGEAQTRLPLAESLDGHLPRFARGWRGLLGNLRIMARIVAWVLLKGRARALRVEQDVPLNAQRARLLFMRLEGGLVESLAARARAEGTTVHGALSAAIVLGSLDDIGHPQAHVMFSSPINMRDRLTPAVGDDVGFFITGGYSSHRVDAGSSFWALARELKQGLNEAIDAGVPFFGLTSLSSALMGLHRLVGGGERGMRLAARGLASVMQDGFSLTNIGRVNIEPRYGNFAVDALGFVASPSFLSSNVFFAATLGDAMSLNFVVMEPRISTVTQQRVAARVRAQLESAVL